MDYKTLISVEDLKLNYQKPDWVIIDCHFLLDKPEAGYYAYLEKHIPGAQYAHLDRDLSGVVIPGKTGRHPLPDPERFAQTLSNWGVDSSVQVVVYDNRGGIIASRLWWMLRWLGHEKVAVLDGSFSHWLSAGYAVKEGKEKPENRIFSGLVNENIVFNLNDVLLTMRNKSNYKIIDSRAPDRFSGLVEPIDPIAGHIPNAINYFFAENLSEDGFFLPPALLKQRLLSLFGDTPSQKAVFYCGSGVTSTHNILAAVHAGLKMPLLYPGSWSEWIADPNRPIIQKDE